MSFWAALFVFLIAIQSFWVKKILTEFRGILYEHISFFNLIYELKENLEIFFYILQYTGTDRFHKINV